MCTNELQLENSAAGMEDAVLKKFGVSPSTMQFSDPAAFGWPFKKKKRQINVNKLLIITYRTQSFWHTVHRVGFPGATD